MKQKTKTTWVVILFVILLILIGISFYGNIVAQTVFPDELTSPNIKITNQKGELNFLEGDSIIPISTEGFGCGSGGSCVTGIKGYMVFVNDKLHKISGSYANTPHYSVCGTASTSEVYWENDCGSFQYAYKNLLRCSNDNICDYPKIDKLEAGNNQEVEVLMSLSKNDGGVVYQYNRFKINVQPLPCVLSDQQLIVSETFRSGSTLSKNTLRYPPVKFCSALAPLRISAFTLTATTDLNIYTKLNNNHEIIVPNNEIISIFYVIDNKPEYNLPLICEVK